MDCATDTTLPACRKASCGIASLCRRHAGYRAVELTAGISLKAKADVLIGINHVGRDSLFTINTKGIKSYKADIDPSIREETDARYISRKNASRVMAIGQNTPFCINTFTTNMLAGLNNP